MRDDGAGMNDWRVAVVAAAAATLAAGLWLGVPSGVRSVGPGPGEARATASPPGCDCGPLPATLRMTSSDEAADHGMFRPGTLTYRPTPPEYRKLNLGSALYMGDRDFADADSGGLKFRYIMTCRGRRFALSRIYLYTPLGTLLDGADYAWVAGEGANAAGPGGLRLVEGEPFAGSEPVRVTLEGP